jgi:peroxiredoxin family protein
MAFGSGAQTLQSPVDENQLMDIPIEQALSASQTTNLQEFILLAQRMQFRVIVCAY